VDSASSNFSDRRHVFARLLDSSLGAATGSIDTLSASSVVSSQTGDNCFFAAVACYTTLAMVAHFGDDFTGQITQS